MTKHIDMNSWPRKEIFKFHSHTSNPFYMVTFTVDVTNVYEFAKVNGLSFYYSMIHCCTKAINQVPNFLYDIDHSEVIQHDLRHPSFTDLKKDTDLYHIVTMDFDDDIVTFCQRAEALSTAQSFFIDYTKEGTNLIFFSCLPWINLTTLTNEHDLSNPNEKDDTFPRIAWGQYSDNAGRKTLSLSLEVNHRLIDGYHIGQFNEALVSIIHSLI